MTATENHNTEIMQPVTRLFAFRYRLRDCNNAFSQKRARVCECHERARSLEGLAGLRDAQEDPLPR
eukprot:4965720-Pleurochrysis_carterae.AAC.1